MSNTSDASGEAGRQHYARRNPNRRIGGSRREQSDERKGRRGARKSDDDNEAGKKSATSQSQSQQAVSPLHTAAAVAALKTLRQSRPVPPSVDDPM